MLFFFHSWNASLQRPPKVPFPAFYPRCCLRPCYDEKSSILGRVGSSTPWIPFLNFDWGCPCIAAFLLLVAGDRLVQHGCQNLALLFPSGHFAMPGTPCAPRGPDVTSFGSLASPNSQCIEPLADPLVHPPTVWAICMMIKISADDCLFSRTRRLSPVAIVDQAISCSNVRMIFLRHELFWFCLVQVSTTQFCWFPPAFIARLDDASDRPVPVSPSPATSSNFGSPGGSAPDLDGMGGRQTGEQLKEIREIAVTTRAERCQ